jgi:hypothetical protein
MNAKESFENLAISVPSLEVVRERYKASREPYAEAALVLEDLIGRVERPNRNSYHSVPVLTPEAADLVAEALRNAGWPVEIEYTPDEIQINCDLFGENSDIL